VELVHSGHIIHRDIKPSNFVVGVGNDDNQVSVIDFGLAQKYRDKNTRCHIPYSENHPLAGTAAFTSITSHQGRQQSRRDDLESLAYIFIYFLTGSLPWYGINPITKRHRHRSQNTTLQKKMSLSPDGLCPPCPAEFGVFLKYAHNLQFDSKPDYAFARGLFSDLFVCHGYDRECSFDWHVGG